MNENSQNTEIPAIERLAEEVRSQLSRLGQAYRYLRSTGSLIGYLTVANISVAIVPWMFVACSVWSVDMARAVSCASAIVSLLTIITIVSFERVCKQGQVRYETVADEMKRQPEDGGLGQYDAEIPMDARGVMRAFSSACDLPLVPGRFGPHVYGLINVVMPLLAFLIVRASAR